MRAMKATHYFLTKKVKTQKDKMKKLLKKKTFHDEFLALEKVGGGKNPVA